MDAKQHGYSRLFPFSILPFFWSCSTESADSEAPAQVEDPVQEADLTTIHPTEEAERRVGIELGTAEVRAVQRRRSFGGELMAASVMVLVAGGLTFTPRTTLGQTMQELRPGQVVQGSADWEGSAQYSFKAETAGVLTVVARSLDESDLQLLVADMDGQPLPEGRSDQDLGGDVGAEQFAVTLPRGGTYRVVVETFAGGQATFQVGVSWIPFPDLGVPADPDGSPSSAQRISVGQEAHEDSIDGATGDYWDWFVLKADKAGTLTLATRTDGGDLVLEAFEAGNFAEPLERSDQDLQGNGGNEAVTLVVEPGQEFFFKISAFSEGVSGPYRLQIGFIPG